MAVLGVALTGLLATVALAVLFARLLADSVRPLSGALLGAVFAVANDVSGRTAFALGGVAALSALLLLPRRRPAAVAAVLTGLLSPVAAAFLGLVAAVLVLQRRPGGWTLGLACSIPVTVVALLFPGGGRQPYSFGSALPLLLLALVTALFVTHPLVRTGALLYAGAVAFFSVSHDPFGSNITRLGALVGAAMLVAYARRLTVPLVIVVAYCLTWQLNPTKADLSARPSPPMSALIGALEARDAHRVEVVPVRDHSEAYRVAEQVPLARGWLRQTDVRDNPLFYDGRLLAPTYLAWLREHAVDHVALPRRSLLDYGGFRENRLLREPVAGLSPVWQDDDWTVFAVRDPEPLVSATLVSRPAGRRSCCAPTPQETSTVRIRWSRWLTLDGPACLERKGDGIEGVVVRFSAPGTVTLGSSLLPSNHC